MQITLNQKVAAIVGGTIAVAVAVGGGTIAYNNHKAAQEKKAAELAYANRPIIEVSCTMNGYGQGECNFTNSGKSTGAKCGTINVQGPGVVQSDKFCSGMVQPMSTEKVEFKIPAVDELCDNGFEDWRDKCSFDFYEAAPNGAATTNV
jgi:hypothetical protein